MEYKVVGDNQFGFAVTDAKGGTLYDLIESRTEADSIRDVLNSGIGPEWNAVENELAMRMGGGKMELMSKNDCAFCEKAL